ncbi:MAG: class I SAM-dependent methyltransferase [Candidatus Micrarchaeia archaeon]
MNKTAYQIFSRVYRYYDLVTHFFSFGFDIKWRKDAAKAAVLLCKKLGYKKIDVLDLGAGTCDFSIIFAKEACKNRIKASIYALDFSANMLNIARRKAEKSGVKLHFINGNALDIPFKDKQFDLVISGLAVRNFVDTKKFATESYRVLRNGGALVVLEMSKPKKHIYKSIYVVYSRLLKPIGMLINKKAYNWLFATMDSFNPHALCNDIKKAGFSSIYLKYLAFHVAYVIIALKD